eukprot:TRINITY_DN12006_c0_g1_i1.p1 TRINITY_DN12006_c0_g1~~TRINITY_DN12006_c0_g1_i1.p1  ORF type:complete len:677 (+),score=142.27 TRINITY_DN12006_c0_g1_i1:766-2796(+)
MAHEAFADWLLLHRPAPDAQRRLWWPHVSGATQMRRVASEAGESRLASQRPVGGAAPSLEGSSQRAAEAVAADPGLRVAEGPPGLGALRQLGQLLAHGLHSGDQSQVYWQLRHAASDRRMARGYYSSGRRGLLCDEAVLRGLLRDRLPDTACHLERLCSDDGPTARFWRAWLTLPGESEAGAPPSEMQLRLADLWMLRGQAAPLRGAVALASLTTEGIASAASDSAVESALQQRTATQRDLPRELLAAVLRQPLSADELSARRDEPRQPRLDAEMLGEGSALPPASAPGPGVIAVQHGVILRRDVAADSAFIAHAPGGAGVQILAVADGRCQLRVAVPVPGAATANAEGWAWIRNGDRHVLVAQSGGWAEAARLSSTPDDPRVPGSAGSLQRRAAGSPGPPRADVVYRQDSALTEGAPTGFALRHVSSGRCAEWDQLNGILVWRGGEGDVFRVLPGGRELVHNRTGLFVCVGNGGALTLRPEPCGEAWDYDESEGTLLEVGSTGGAVCCGPRGEVAMAAEEGSVVSLTPREGQPPASRTGGRDFTAEAAARQLWGGAGPRVLSPEAGPLLARPLLRPMPLPGIGPGAEAARAAAAELERGAQRLRALHAQDGEGESAQLRREEAAQRERIVRFFSLVGVQRTAMTAQLRRPRAEGHDVVAISSLRKASPSRPPPSL